MMIYEELGKPRRGHLIRKGFGGGQERLPKTGCNFTELHRGKLFQTQQRTGHSLRNGGWGRGGGAEAIQNTGPIQQT